MSNADDNTARKVSLIEERLDTERVSALTVGGQQPGQILGVAFGSMLEVMEFSKLMSVSGSAVPPHLRGNPGTCLAITMRAVELKMSPFTVANWSYETENKGVKRISFESAFYNAVILARAPTKDRPHYEIIGEGEERRCKVWATIRGETEPRIFLSDTLAKLRPGRNDYGTTKGSPLWDKKPEVQLMYNAIRDFARIYFPDVTAGLYTNDEFEEELTSPRDVTSLSERLAPRATGEGFNHKAEEIEAALAGAKASRINPELNSQGPVGYHGPDQYREGSTAPAGAKAANPNVSGTATLIVKPDGSVSGYPPGTVVTPTAPAEAAQAPAPEPAATAPPAQQDAPPATRRKRQPKPEAVPNDPDAITFLDPIRYGGPEYLPYLGLWMSQAPTAEYIARRFHAETSLRNSLGTPLTAEEREQAAAMRNAAMERLKGV